MKRNRIARSGDDSKHRRAWIISEEARSYEKVLIQLDGKEKDEPLLRCTELKAVPSLPRKRGHALYPLTLILPDRSIFKGYVVRISVLVGNTRCCG